MSFREQMSQMRRDYREEAERLDQRIDHLVDKVDHGFGVVQERLGRVGETVGLVQLQLQTVRDELVHCTRKFRNLRDDPAA